MANVAPARRMLVRGGEEAAWIILLIGGLFLGGCNVFDGLSPEPSSVDALLADARTALAAGTPSRAVQLLERAYDRDSTDVRVRIELGNALYAERGLDVFTLRAAAEHLVGASGSSDSSAAVRSSPNGRSCTDGAQPELRSDRYDRIPVDADPLRRLADRAAVVQRVRRLVVTGVLGRRAEAFSTTEARVRRKGLLVGAVTAGATGVIDARAVLEATGSALYLDRAADPHRALVACAGTDASLGQNRDALCTLEAAARQGVQWLQTRNRLSETDRESVLIGPLRRLADAASARIDCS